MINRNVIILFFAQLIFVSGSMVLVTLGGIVGNDLAPSRSLATLPLSVMVIGTALTTIPASLLMQRIGRRYGFALAALVACCGALTAAYGLETENFVWFCVAATLVGMGVGAGDAGSVVGMISGFLVGTVVGATVGTSTPHTNLRGSPTTLPEAQALPSPLSSK